jgi:hypothetical protein
MVLYMRALIIHAPHVATISEINTPTPPSEWTLVKPSLWVFVVLIKPMIDLKITVISCEYFTIRFR